jgi:hypothetical protein
MAAACESILEMLHNQHPEDQELLARLVDAEVQERQRRRMTSYLRTDQQTALRRPLAATKKCELCSSKLERS